MLRVPVAEKATKSSYSSNLRSKEQVSFWFGNKEHKIIGLLCPTEKWSTALSVDDPRPKVAWVITYHRLTMQHIPHQEKKHKDKISKSKNDLE